MYLIGIDVGTTAVKAVLVSEDGMIVADASSSYDVSSVETNWFEQDPEDWWRAAVTCIHQMIEQSHIKPSDIGGIGLSGQYHGLVIVDKNRDVLRPCIMWNDQRTAKQSAEIVDKVGTERLLRIAGTPGAPYFTACKLYWVKENEPAIYDKIDKLMLPKDYVRMKLTGEIATDVTDASGTLFLDVGARAWSDEMLERTEVNRSVLPELVESPDVSGTVSRQAAEETGLHAGIPVVGGGDQACAAIGNGIVDEGTAAYSIGTSGVIYAATKELKVDPLNRINSFCHAVPGSWCLLACINAAAGSLAWFEQQFGTLERRKAEKSGKNVYSHFIDLASSIPPGSDKLFFLPYLAGERHPHTDPNARGAFIGLHSGHTKAHAIRSVLEGVAYSFRDCLEVIRELDVPVNEIRATGGGAQSELWLQIQVNASGEAIRKETNADEGGAAYGAAILASVGSGYFSNVNEACSRLVRVGDRMEVEPALARLYDRYFQFYRTLYPILQQSYQSLAALE